MKFMTFNIRHAFGLDELINLERVIEVIALSGADVIALQEVDRYMPRSGDVDQAAELARALQMDWRYAASIRHGRSEYGNAIFCRCPIMDDQVVYFPGEKERRSLLKVKLDMANRGFVEMMTTHLGVSERDRRRQMPLLLTELQEVDIPAILMGDFNMESDHTLMKGMYELGWQEMKLDRNQYSGTVIGGKTIDHIIGSGIGEGCDAYLIPTAASDHRPVVVEIPLPML